MKKTNYNDNTLSKANVALGIQHLFAMFGATVLVPLITGFNISTALVCAGLGTIVFHFITGHKVPVFLGSSFAFIPAIAAVAANPAYGSDGLLYAQGGIVAAGVVYLLFSLLVKAAGPARIKSLFPPVVTGPVIAVVGLGLAYFAVNKAGLLNIGKSPTEGGLDWLIALFVVCVIVGMTVFSKGFFKLVPILTGIVSGYLLCMILSLLGVFEMDFTAISQAPWINIPFVTANANGVPFFSLPKFDWGAILTIAPVALVTFMEHIGDITTNGNVVGKDFFVDPGLHKTVLGDGIATALAGFLGGPANTTYSENTGVLATTKNYNPFVIKLAAIFAICLGFVGKFGAVLETIPGPVMGGVGLILYGMIAAIGIRTLAEADLDFTHSRNLMIVALILVLGIGITIASYNGSSPAGIAVNFGNVTFNFSGLFIAVIAGVITNLILPREE